MNTTPDTHRQPMLESQYTQAEQMSMVPQPTPPTSPQPSEIPPHLAIYGANREIMEFIKKNVVPATVLPKPAPLYTSEELQTILFEEAEGIIEQKSGRSELTASEILKTLHRSGKCQDLRKANSIGDALGKSGLNLPRVQRNGKTYYNLNGMSLSKDERDAMQQIMNAKVMMQRQKRAW
jgi:hypothetical protein